MDSQFYDHLLLPSDSASELLIRKCLKQLYNDGFIIVQHIRKTKDSFDTWTRLITLSSITVSIDLYSLGLLFIRKEQTKQHFVVRW